MEKVSGRLWLNRIPHKKGTIDFGYPAYRGTLAQVAHAIDSDGLARPNSEETVSLVDDSWKNPEGDAEREIINILDDHWLLEYTGNLYLPKTKGDYQNGIILWEGLEFDDNGIIKPNKTDLVARLERGDKTARFVPFGFKTGEQSVGELGRNVYTIGRYGEEGAAKLAEVASKYKLNPFWLC